MELLKLGGYNAKQTAAILKMRKNRKDCRVRICYSWARFVLLVPSQNTGQNLPKYTKFFVHRNRLGCSLVAVQCFQKGNLQLILFECIDHVASVVNGSQFTDGAFYSTIYNRATHTRAFDCVEFSVLKPKLELYLRPRIEVDLS